MFRLNLSAHCPDPYVYREQKSSDNASGYPTNGDSYRRCSATDPTITCDGSSSGSLAVSETEMRRRCSADLACLGYGYQSSASSYRPFKNISSVTADASWSTFRRVRCADGFRNNSRDPWYSIMTWAFDFDSACGGLTDLSANGLTAISRTGLSLTII